MKQAGSDLAASGLALRNRIEERAAGVPIGWMDDQASPFVHGEQILILIEHGVRAGGRRRTGWLIQRCAGCWLSHGVLVLSRLFADVSFECTVCARIRTTRPLTA